MPVVYCFFSLGRRFPPGLRFLAGVLLAWAGSAFPCWPAAQRSPGDLFSPAAPTDADIASEIEITLNAPDFEDLDGDLSLLPSSAPVRLQAAVASHVAEKLGLQVEQEKLRWQSNGGVLLLTDSSPDNPENSWMPPDESAVSTVVVSYEARFHPRGIPDASRRIRVVKTASHDFLSPTRPEQFQNGMVDGFQIGDYPDPSDPGVFARFAAEESQWPRLYPWVYKAPEGFYKVTRDNIDRRISKNFTLRFFAMDFPWRSEGFPQYIALDQRLVHKMEDLLTLTQAHGLVRGVFCPIYGFRPPAYNLGAIQHDGTYTLKAPFSMHQYGRAIDLIVDEDGDLIMDDLNGDGFHDIMDAAELMKYVDVLDYGYRKTGSDRVGGAGIYPRHDFIERPVQSPYVHVDVRGFCGVGGVLIRWPSHWPAGAPIVWKDMYPNWFVRAPRHNGGP